MQRVTFENEFVVRGHGPIHGQFYEKEADAFGIGDRLYYVVITHKKLGVIKLGWHCGLQYYDIENDCSFHIESAVIKSTTATQYKIVHDSPTQAGNNFWAQGRIFKVNACGSPEEARKKVLGYVDSHLEYVAKQIEDLQKDHKQHVLFKDILNAKLATVH